jgi:hypothetical protein
VLVGLVLAVAVPLAKAEESQDKKPVKPAHVVLHNELLAEQQTLQRLQTEWLLQLAKTKQSLDKKGTALAGRESEVCAKLLDSARELPALYETVTARLDGGSLANLPTIEKTLKASTKLTGELHRVCEVLKSAPPEAFRTERALSDEETALALSVVEAANWAETMHSNGTADAAPLRAILEDRLKRFKALDSSRATKPVARSSVQGLAASLDKMLADGGLLGPAPPPPDRPGDTLPTKGSPIDRSGADHNFVRNLQSAFESLRDSNSRLIAVAGLRQLADRQQRLHDRLQKQRDEVVSRLLEGIE